MVKVTQAMNVVVFYQNLAPGMENWKNARREATQCDVDPAILPWSISLTEQYNGLCTPCPVQL